MIKIIHGNLLEQDVEAIVNAANPYLEVGGGIAGMIHHASGPELVAACREYKKMHNIERIDVGEAVVTPAFKIAKIKYVIHTVGPNCAIASDNRDRKRLLEKTYLNSLEKAREMGIRSLAFPAISTGIYGYPFEEAQEVVFKAIEEYLNQHLTVFDEVRLVYYSQEDFIAAQHLWNQHVKNL